MLWYVQFRLPSSNSYGIKWHFWRGQPLKVPANSTVLWFYDKRTFWTDIYTHFTEGVLRTKPKLKLLWILEDLNSDCLDPFTTPQMNKKFIKTQSHLYYRNTASCCFQHSSWRVYNAGKEFKKVAACSVPHWSKWTVNTVQLRCKLSLTHSRDESFSSAVL